MRHALVVDDKEENRYLLEALLGASEYSVSSARNGVEALAIARQIAPDVVISDLLMPVMDGYTLLRHWRADPDLKAIPFIVYTATYTEDEDQQLAMDLGADAFILKPMEPEELLQRLDAVQRAPVALGALPSSPERADETDLLKVYSRTLIRKLEEKSLQLEGLNRTLRQDIERRQAVEAALRSSEERLRQVVQATNDAIWEWDINADTRWWSRGFETLFGHSQLDEGSASEAWRSLVHPDDRARILADLDHAIRSDATSWSGRYRLQRADGSWAEVEDRARLIRAEAGAVVRMVGGMSDVSHRVALEEQFRKSQRLEAVGQLTGGIAHDFNNLLTVVLGSAETLCAQLAEGEQHALATMIVEAAERGAELTRRLLAFARKQTLAPKAVELGALVDDLHVLLTRVLGRSVRIEIAHETPVVALVDPVQLEHALLNLCVNARDAMPDGGLLRIRTAVSPLSDEASGSDGSAANYALLEVLDSGIGIHPEHLSYVFEPFFTTKDESKGSGLGLAMVYGFVRQSEGHITVNSELGKGTAFRLYLPLSTEMPALASRVQGITTIASGEGTVLLVEDDDLVRPLAQAQLESLGYQTLVAASGEDAMRFLESDATIDLLFTDLVMPGMGGRELVRRAQQLRPALKVLYTSGFAGCGQGDAALSPADAPVLGKPYRREQMANKVLEALRGQQTAADS